MNKSSKCIIGLLMWSILCGIYGADNIVKGFDPKNPASALTLNKGKYTCFTGQLVDSFWEYPTDGSNDVTWQSAIVDKKLSDKAVIFRFACGFGAHYEAALHKVFINDTLLLSFKTQYNDFTVNSPNATFKFTAIYIDDNDDLFGIAELKVASNLIHFGKSQKFRVLGTKANSKAWFMLSDVQIPPRSKIAQLKVDNKIQRRVEVTKIIRAKEQKKQDTEKRYYSISRICNWPWNCQAAVSLVKKGESLDGYNGAQQLEIDFPQKNDIFETAVDNTIEKKQWLIVKYAKKYFSSPQPPNLAANRSYLKQLELVLWNASPGKIAEYIRMRKQAKLIVEKKQPGHLTLSLHGFPPGFKANLPLTVQVVMPKKAWDFMVVDNNKNEIPHKYFVIKNQNCLYFNIKPKCGAIDIYYNL